MRRSRTGAAAALLAACGLSILTACGAKTDNNAGISSTAGAQEKESAAQITESGKTDEEERPETSQSGEETAAETLLHDMTEAIEAQYPEQTFSDLADTEERVAGLPYKDSYAFSGRSSSEGWQYIAGVCKTSDDPLAGLSCGTAPAVMEFSMSQFDGGRLMLMENSGGKDTGLSFLYDALQQGEDGVRYLAGTKERGVRLVPPEKGAFLKVSLVKNGILVTEFIPVTEEEEKAIKAGRETKGPEGLPAGGLVFCENREELTASWNGNDTPLTEEMFMLAVEKSGFQSGSPSKVRDLTKAVLKVNAYGGTREETIENRDDLDAIEALLSGASYEASGQFGRYEGTLTLTNQEGIQSELKLRSDGGGVVWGNSVPASLSEADTEKLWSMFTTIEGFRKYGDSLSLKMEKLEISAEEENLRFTLVNGTGKPIQYILSPNLYKKEGDSWKWMENIAGYCGFVSDMEGEELLLSIPFKDAFALEGEGTYRVEFTVMPEPDLRFDVSGDFHVK